MSKLWEVLKPIIVLTCVCLIVTACLAFTNSLTAPIIAEQGSSESDKLREEVLTDADGFEKIEITEDITAKTGVYEAHASKNHVGIVISMKATGYAGKDTLDLMFGFAPDGVLKGIKVVASGETEGLGSRALEDAYIANFIGKGGLTYKSVNTAPSADNEVQAIGGATISSKAVVDAVNLANDAFNMLKGAGLIG